MKSLFDYIQENEGGVFSTPSTTMGMGNPGVLPDGTLTEPIVTAKCKKEKLKKKKVSESILDDDDELIKQTKESTKWRNIVYNMLVRNASVLSMGVMQEVCIEWLNKHVKFSNNSKAQWYKDSPIWQNHTHTTYGIAGYNGISLMSFDADPGHNELYVYFPDFRRMRPRYKEAYIKSLREEFNMTEKDYINFKQDIIDEFKLKLDRHFASGDVWKSELK